MCLKRARLLQSSAACINTGQMFILVQIPYVHFASTIFSGRHKSRLHLSLLHFKIPCFQRWAAVHAHKTPPLFFFYSRSEFNIFMALIGKTGEIRFYSNLVILLYFTFLFLLLHALLSAFITLTKAIQLIPPFITRILKSHMKTFKCVCVCQGVGGWMLPKCPCM